MDVIREGLKGSCFDPSMEDIFKRQLGEFLYNLPVLLIRADIDSAITTGVDTDTIQELILENIDNLVYKWCEVENEVFSIYLAAIKEIDKRIKVCDYLVVK